MRGAYGKSLGTGDSGGSAASASSLPESLTRDLSRHPQGNLSRATAPAVAPSLVSLKNNRNKPCFCGRMSLMGATAVTKGQVLRLGCKTWRCKRCGPKKAKRVRLAIAKEAAKRKLSRFLTLTLNPKDCTSEDSISHIRNSWNKLRVSLQRKMGRSISFIQVIEFQKSGYAHLHILVDCFIPQRWISKAWESVGGGNRPYIKQVDCQRVSAYLSKYLSKDLILGRHDQKYRRYTTSRDIRLFEKPEKGNWTLVNTPIQLLYIR